MAQHPERSPRLHNAAGSILMVPMDHGISMGPAHGIASPGPAIEAAVAGGATCLTLHKGLVRHALPFADRVGILMHLSASTDLAPDPHDKRIVGTVEEALALGCHGVSVHINLGSRTEADQIEAVGRVGTACNLLGVPLVAMVYPRGPGIRDPFDAGLVAHAARLGAELGADAVKVPYTGDPDSFRAVVDGAGVPVLVAGGPRLPDFDTFLAQLHDARHAGAAGVSVGRNVFQHPDPRAAMAAVAACFP